MVILKIPRPIIYCLIILLVISFIYFVYPKYQLKTIKYGKDIILVIKKIEPSLQGKFPMKVKAPFPIKVKVPKK